VAIDGYLFHAGKSLDPEWWVPAFDSLRRAVALSATVDKNTPAYLATLDRVNAIAIGVGQDDPKYFTMKVLDLLIDHRYPNREPLRSNVRAAAEAAAQASDVHRAVDLLGAVQKCLRVAKDQPEERVVRCRIAEVFELGAENAASQEQHGLAETFQVEAVKAWRAVGDEGTRETAARVRLQQFQRAHVESMKERQGGEVDLSSCIAAAKTRVSGKEPLIAIRNLLLLSHPRRICDVRASVQKRLGEFVMYSLFGTQTISGAGRRTHRRGPVMATGTGDNSESDIAQEALDDEVRTVLSMGWQMLAMGGIMPAVQQIQIEHNLGAAWLWQYVVRSQFVPRGRHLSYVRGLELGLLGDYTTAAHLLMPQFENSVRWLLEQRGAVVSTLPDSEEQNELDLNKLLRTKEAEEVFGSDQLFELAALLIDKGGVNLRNELAHGLFDDGARENHCAYFWWVTLRFVMFEAVRNNPNNDPPTAAEDSPGDESGQAQVVAVEEIGSDDVSSHVVATGADPPNSALQQATEDGRC
jgi:hypothetical protein